MRTRFFITTVRAGGLPCASTTSRARAYWIARSFCLVTGCVCVVYRSSRAGRLRIVRRFAPPPLRAA